MTLVSLQDEVAATLGSAVTSARAVAGGDINQAQQMVLADGRVVFVKSNPQAPPAMFAAEARGLAWLEKAQALRVPRVLHVAEGFLVLEHLGSGRRRANFDEHLGRGLAALHRFGAPGFGLDHDNYIGRLPQTNAAAPTWPEFYRERRLEPQWRLAREAGLCPPSLARGFEQLLAVLEDRVGPPEPPARLHGDLWGGNLMVDESGAPCLIDPAVYGGHREVDLAMMQLFGGFGPKVFSAYEEAWPLAPGYGERAPLYQLYFLMVHVNLFGRSYLAQAEHALRSII